jgi:hypothetical protein
MGLVRFQTEELEPMWSRGVVSARHEFGLTQKRIALDVSHAPPAVFALPGVLQALAHIRR